MRGTVLKVAVVDDDPKFLDIVARRLRLADIDVLAVEAHVGVTNAVRAFKPDVVLIDLHTSAHMPIKQLIDLMRRKDQIPNAEYVIFSSSCAEELRRTQLAVGAKMALLKSDLKQVVLAIKSFESSS
jgi:DNA-binding NarL/FixJ family response regulator